MFSCSTIKPSNSIRKTIKSNEIIKKNYNSIDEQYKSPIKKEIFNYIVQLQKKYNCNKQNQQQRKEMCLKKCFQTILNEYDIDYNEIFDIYSDGIIKRW